MVELYESGVGSLEFAQRELDTVVLCLFVSWSLTGSVLVCNDMNMLCVLFIKITPFSHHWVFKSWMCSNILLEDNIPYCITVKFLTLRILQLTSNTTFLYMMQNSSSDSIQTGFFVLITLHSRKREITFIFTASSETCSIRLRVMRFSNWFNLHLSCVALCLCAQGDGSQVRVTWFWTPLSNDSIKLEKETGIDFRVK